MRQRSFFLQLLLPCLFALPASGQNVAVEEFTLDNGMEFLLLPRDDQPNSITAGWMAKVGSANERPGITGISHFFEHMMFKGTRTVGTSDPAKDAEFSSKQKAVRTSLRGLHLGLQYSRWKGGEIEDPWDPANDTDEMRRLRDELRKLQEAQREITVKNEFDRIYTNLGGSGMNAFTTHDLTFYFITVPSNKFELWSWMESDRLSASVFREFYSERDVVHEERRLRTESTPTGIFQEQFDAMFWQSSPYTWPVVGWTSDLNSYTREQAEDYYSTYYSPNNIVGVVVGDFDTAEVKVQLARYFGRLERAEEPPTVVTLEMPQVAEKRMLAECDCQPQVEVRYHSVPFAHRDEAPLEMLAEVLNGRTGRLYKNLIEGLEVASSARAQQDSRKYAGAFVFSGECKGEATPEELEQAWYGELARMQEEPVSERELEKVKNRVLAESFRRLASNFFLLLQLGFYEGLGGWEYINTQPARMREVTAADIQRVAKAYFGETNRSVAIYKRKEGTQPEDDELAGLDPQMRGWVKRALGQIGQITDAEQLRGMLAQMDARADQVPPEARLAADIIRKKARERLAELEAADK